MQVKFVLLHSNAKLPERGHAIDVGLDVFTPEGGMLKPGPNKIPLGFAVDVPVGYNASIYPRSGMASGEKTKDLQVAGMDSPLPVSHFYADGVGILAQMPPIDPGYSGEVHAIVINTSKLYIEYPEHTRFGQLVFHPIAYAQPVVEVDISRGTAGFGSTGA